MMNTADFFQRSIDMLKAEGIRLQGPLESGVYSYEYTGIHGSWVCILKTDPHSDVVTVYTFLHYDAAGCNKNELLQFINESNYYLYRGCWVYDKKASTIHLRVENHEQYGENITEEIKTMLKYSCRMADDFFPGFLLLEDGWGSSDEAIETVKRAIDGYDVSM